MCTTKDSDATAVWLWQALGCGPGEHEGHVKALVAGKKDSIKAQKGLMEELAALHGRELAHQCQQQGLCSGSCMRAV